MNQQCLEFSSLGLCRNRNEWSFHLKDKSIISTLTKLISPINMIQHNSHLFAIKLLILLCDIGLTLVKPSINVTRCGQGHARWSQDNKCYKLYSQGPCNDPDQVYLPSSSFQSFAECRSFENYENEASISSTTTTSVLDSVISSESVTKCGEKHGWHLPSRVKLLSNQEKNCLWQEKVTTTILS